jgi:hypothetical protein
MYCFNYNCPFYNKITSCCRCITCPNRRETYTTTYVSNHTLTDSELAILRANKYLNKEE